MDWTLRGVAPWGKRAVWELSPTKHVLQAPLLHQLTNLSVLLCAIFLFQQGAGHGGLEAVLHQAGVPPQENIPDLLPADHQLRPAGGDAIGQLAQDEEEGEEKGKMPVLKW